MVAYEKTMESPQISKVKTTINTSFQQNNCCDDKEYKKKKFKIEEESDFHEPKEPSVGRWTEEEHRLFLEGLQRFPYRAWKKIATLIETRTVVQIRTHAQKYYQKLAKDQETKARQGSNSLDKLSNDEIDPKKLARGRKRKCEGGFKKHKRRSLIQDGETSFKCINMVSRDKLIENPIDKAIREHNQEIGDDQLSISKSLQLVSNGIDLDNGPFVCVDDLSFLRLSPMQDEDVVSEFSDEEWLSNDSNGESSPLTQISATSNCTTTSHFSTTSQILHRQDDIEISPLYGNSDSSGDSEDDDIFPIYKMFENSSKAQSVLDPKVFVNDFFTNPK